MRELRLVAVADDGRLLLATSGQPASEQYALPITEDLRAVVGDDRPRNGQRENTVDSKTVDSKTVDGASVDSQLSPKEIQARIRHGERAEDVARVAGVSLERVRRFEWPVLAERGHIAELAQSGSLRRAGGHISPLRDIVAAGLGKLGVDPATAQWDAWRREDGRWTVEVLFPRGAGEQVAHYTYDGGARASVPADDDARELVGEPRLAAAGPARLVPVQDLVDEPAERDEWDEAISSRESRAPEMPAPAPTVPEADSPIAGPPAETPAPQPVRRRAVAAGGRGRRASVPSWDEIVFGRGSAEQ